MESFQAGGGQNRSAILFEVKNCSLLKKIKRHPTLKLAGRK